MKWLSMILLALVTTAGCSNPAGLSGTGATLRWGTSFGECVGYCRSELEITRAVSRLTLSGWDAAKYPPKVQQLPLPAGAWEALDAQLRAADLEGLNAVYGCPDCADGGAEWVELESPDLKKRVAYEYGKPPAALQPLLERIAQLRGGYPQ